MDDKWNGNEGDLFQTERINFDDSLHADVEDHELGASLETLDTFRSEAILGNHTEIYRYGDKIILTLGPHWYVAALGIAMLSAFAIYSYITFWENYSEVMKIAYSIVVPLEISLYIITALLNPGIIARRVPSFGKGKIRCRECLTTEDDKAFHCNDCGVCITGHDHHCIWTGKCIGKGNFVPFIFFVVCTPCYFIMLFLGSMSGVGK